MIRTHRRRSRDAGGGESGFTVIELLVAMALSVGVMLVALQSLDLFTKTSGQQTRATDANTQVRAAMDRVVNDLRGAAMLRGAGPTDLVYSVMETTGVRTERLCLSSGLLLYRATSMSTTSATSACGTTDAGWSVARVSTLPATSATAFTYDGAASSASPATVRSVGLSLGLSAAGNGETSTSVLRAGATVRRAAGTLPLTSDDVVPTCNAAGVLLTLSAAATSSPGLGTLGVTYRNTAGALLGSTTGTSGVQLASAAAAATIVATITDTTGASTTVERTLACG